MLNVADDIERITQRSNNSVMQDFGTFSAQYQRAFAKALPTYTRNDDELEGAAECTRVTFRDACSAVGP
jgi:hypothetical protein